jgi:hypothetical protein
MTVVPGEYKLVIPQRATLEETFWLPFDASAIVTAGAPAGFYASIWTSDKRETLLLGLSAIVDDPIVIGEDPENPLSEECKIRVRADWDDTKTVTRNGYWDLLVVWPNGDRDFYLQGPAVLDRNVTEVP